MNPVTASIISAIITGLFSLAGVYISNKKGQAVMAYRLEQLEKKVDQHNKIVERTYILEGDVKELQHDVRDMKGARK